MVSSRSRGHATTCGQWALLPPGRSVPLSAFAVSSSLSGVTAEAEVSSLRERKGLESVDTAQAERRRGAKSSPERPHRRSKKTASARFNLVRTRLDMSRLTALYAGLEQESDCLMSRAANFPNGRKLSAVPRRDKAEPESLAARPFAARSSISPRQ